MKQCVKFEEILEYVEFDSKALNFECNFDKLKKLNKLLGKESIRSVPSEFNFDIGGMIDIIENKVFVFRMNKKFDFVSEVFNGWGIYIQIMDIDSMDEFEIIKMELADALWEAIKYILEDK